MKELFLTFDDGPNEQTLRILETLKSFEAKATFFVCGKNCQKHPEILKKIIQEGHSLGLHSFSHSINFFLNFRKEIEKTETIIYQITHQTTRLFRPPLGKLTPGLKNYLLRKGYQIVLWDINSNDWLGLFSPSLFRQLKTGSVLLFHDRYRTSIRLAEILKKLKEQDYFCRPYPQV